MAGVVDLQKVSEWRSRFERFARCGKSVLRFCAAEGVSVPSFYQWRKKLAAREATASVDSRASVDPLASDNPTLLGSGSFAAVRLVGSASVAAWLPGGTRLEIPLGDPRALTLVIETLVRADAQAAAVTISGRPKISGRPMPCDGPMPSGGPKIGGGLRSDRLSVRAGDTSSERVGGASC
jgi:hypothetical protein